jgi:hypothetical protein
MMFPEGPEHAEVKSTEGSVNRGNVRS